MSPLSVSRASVTSAEFVRHFGVWQDRAANEPVVVTHHGRARLVLLASQRYQDLLETEARGGDAGAELRLATLLDRLDACFVAFDHDCRIVLLNTQAAGYFKVRRDAPAGRAAGAEMPDLHRSIAQRHVQRTVACGEAATFDAPSHAYPGEWLRYQSFPFGDGAALIFRNVTIEHALRRMGEARESLACALAEHGSIGTGTISQQARFIAADATLAALVGRPRETMWHVRLVDLLAPDQGLCTAGEIEAVFGSAQPRTFDSWLEPPDGRRRPVRIALAPLNGEYGIDGASVVMTPSM